MKYLLFSICLLCCYNCKDQSAPADKTKDLDISVKNTLSPQEQLSKAKGDYEKNSNNAEALIWYGRRTAYTGAYEDAVNIFTVGINKFPRDARMYRHRGHRYISTRNYDKAIEDFEKAVQLIKGKKDQIEPDGIPNSQGIPISSLHGNIYYHLGLAYYLNNNLKSAKRVYNERFKSHRNDDNVVSGTHWYYMTLRRMGEEEEALKLLSPIKNEMNVIENKSYHDMCLFYKGSLEESKLEISDVSSSSNDVYLYGLGNWYLYEKGDVDKAKQYFDRLLKEGNEFSFAYLAAEADMKRNLVFVNEN